MVAELHPIIAAAADGKLPDWAVVEAERLPHLSAVAGLLGCWADELGLSHQDQRRWRAAGWLHDALRDADPETLNPLRADIPPELRHGPAAAERLAEAGVSDDELLEAIRCHTLGSAGLRRLGRFLYLADYLEPGRMFAPVESAVLRARLPNDAEAVLRIVCERRLKRMLAGGRPIYPETVEFWNELREET